MSPSQSHSLPYLFLLKGKIETHEKVSATIYLKSSRTNKVYSRALPRIPTRYPVETSLKGTSEGQSPIFLPQVIKENPTSLERRRVVVTLEEVSQSDARRFVTLSTES